MPEFNPNNFRAGRGLQAVPRANTAKPSPVTESVKSEGVIATLQRFLSGGEGTFRGAVFLPPDVADKPTLFEPSEEERQAFARQEQGRMTGGAQRPAPEMVETTGPEVGIDTDLFSGDLAPPSLSRAEALREETRKLRDEMRGEQENRVGKNAFLNTLFNAEHVALFGDTGLVPNDPDLNAALFQDLQIAPDGAAGLTENMIKAVTSIVNDPELSDEDRSDRLDFIFDRADMAIGVAQTMQDIATDIADQEALLLLDDGELLEQFGAQAQFVQPRHLEFGLKPPQMDDLLIAIDDYWNGTPLVGAGAAYEKALGDMMKALITSPNLLENGVYDWLVDILAEETEMESSAVKAIIEGALEEAGALTQNWEAPLSLTFYEPHSEQLGVALYVVAKEMGLSESKAQEYATNKHIHSLIAQKSGGQLGWVGPGSQRGMGGLPNDFYVSLFGMNYEDMPRSARTDIYALIEYLETFGGPVQGITNFLQSGGWGY